MEFKLIINKDAPETVVATVKKPSPLTDQIHSLVLSAGESELLTGYLEDEIRRLPCCRVECVTVIDGKSYAIDDRGQQYRLKRRLYELEAVLPDYFIRINKSTLANENLLERFDTSFSGGVDAVMRSGYRDYVSRRCFAAIKRRFNET